MDILTLTLLFAAGSYLLKTGEQRQRIALLASHLGRFQIEKLMERLNEGYLRALGEQDPERQRQIWALHEPIERDLNEQFQRFAESFEKAATADTRINRNPLPYSRFATSR